MAEYILFCSQQANFQTRSMLIPYDKYLLCEELKNDFEEPVFSNYPALKMIKEKLYDAGALYASMTGSGSTLFGIFKKNNIPSLSFDKDFSVFAIK